MISDRPSEIGDRAVPGHWEGDLILGLGKTAIGTLVERTTRFTMLLHLPRMERHGKDKSVKNGPALAGHGAEAVRDAIAGTIMDLPTYLRRSLTWDQGAEMAQHAQLRIDTGLEIYFCDPQSPWQRGSNENTSGLLRQYFPKGTDLSQHGHFGIETAVNMMRGSQAFGAGNIVRVPAPMPHLISQALDADADGVMIPNVGSAAMAEAAVISAKYGPTGRRGACPCVRATGHGVGSWDEYLDYCEENVTVGCIVETVDGVQNFDEIIEVDGIDFIALGQVDLTVALGHRGDYKRPEIAAIFNGLVDKALHKGIDLMVGTLGSEQGLFKILR